MPHRSQHETVELDRPRSVSDDVAGTTELAELTEVLALLDAAVERATVGPDADPGDADADPLDADADPGDADPVPVAGTGAVPDENRTIRRARAVLVRQETARVSGELAEARDRVRGAVERARRSRDASRSRRDRLSRTGARSTPPTSLTDVLERAARGLLERGSEENLEHTLGLIVNGAIFALADATHAGVTLLGDDRAIRSHAPSDRVVAELDALQDRLGEGPCRDAVFERAPVVCHDLAGADGRWPRWASAARRHGIASTLSFPLFGRHDGNAGALNVYADRADVFDEAAVEAGALFSSHAALALHGARRNEQLTDALRSRDVIGQAKGILIERFGLTEDRAFAMLVSSSQDTNMKLRAVAEWVVEETTKPHR